MMVKLTRSKLPRRRQQRATFKHAFQYLAALAIITLALMLTLGASDIQQVQCSSYLDSYFMPTARLALNKIQQSLSPVIGSTAAQQNGEQTSPATKPENSISQTTNSEQIATAAGANAASMQNTFAEQTPSSESGKGESIKEEPAPQPATVDANSDSSKSAVAAETEEPTLTVSSSEMATESDPTSSSAELEVATGDQTNTLSSESKSSGDVKRVETPNEELISATSTTELPAREISSSSVASIDPTATSAAPATTTTSATETTSTIASAKSAEDVVRETELEAVAAVDASIGFGVDLFGSMSDSCYDEYGNARFCEPEFENVAFERQVEVSSECGVTPSRFCTAFLNEGGDQRRNCHICDAHNPKKRHPAAYLTDMNNSNDPTCWVSAPIGANQPINNSAIPLQEQLQPSPKLDNVTLVLNLDKKYEIVYISMQFCSLKPDSLAIHKSGDFGQTWTPYQFYSSQCRRYYNRPVGSKQQSTVGRVDKPEAQCVDSAGSGTSSGRLAFSPQEERSPTGHAAVEKSAEWLEWITMTNIKITLDRHHPNWILASLAHPHSHHHLHQNNRHSLQLRSSAADSNGNGSGNGINSNGTQPDSVTVATETSVESSSASQLTNPSDTFNYAMSDLTVGGRCKCNGHASRCILGKDSRLQCDCRHNTAGRDCERCAPFHFDRPWARATQLDANPCQPCNCNGHSRKCKFDAELYRLSGKRSGGVCFGCRDNTAGRFCHYCKEGFTRDHTKAISDKEVCKHCECHPIGSLGRVCNITTGQCPCKEGVTGLQCNRCAQGYQQSSSPTEPCIKLPENDINWQLTVDGDERSASTSEQQHPAADSSPTTDETSSSGGLTKQLSPELDTGSMTPPAVDQPIDKDDESSDNEQTETVPQLPQQSTVGASRKKLRPSSGQWAQAGGVFPPRSNKLGGQHYTRYHLAQSAARGRHQFPVEPHLMEHEQYESIELDDREPDQYNSRALYYPQQMTHYYAPKSKQRFHQHEFARNQQQRRNGQQGGRYSSVLLQPIDETGSVEDLNSVDEQQDSNGGIGYSSLPTQTNSLFQDENFNQIQVPRRSQQKLRQQQQSLAHMSNARRQQLIQTVSGYEPAAEMATAIASNNELSCGDCQTTSRKMSMRQFCHLDYALKANILSKQVAEDWTKFEVEIQDIFKSPGADSLLGLTHRAIAGGANYIDSTMQPTNDLDSVDERNRSSQTASPAESGVSQNDSQSQQVAGIPPFGHRIKVGSIQPIWVPTEDLSCKCPKLKLRSTYLLMGSVDLKENSANTLQLDRHGVALEWDSSLQKKLLRYQRRQSRGKC